MTGLAAFSVALWIFLLTAHGRFWQAGPVLWPATPASTPDVAVVVPARDEADMVARSLGSLLAQEYAGNFSVILVDDQSRDGTAAIARGLKDPRLTVLTGGPRPAGWSGKLWAVAQGVAAADAAPLVLLTDADIVHDPRHLSTLVAQAESGDFDMVSEMVTLSCESWAERALVPAFVFFFQLLYPFARVNNFQCATAAAAGGTILVRRRALTRIGGIEAVRGALIDDVVLAQAVKKGGKIWLGHSALTHSVRPYPRVADIWRMISRSAYTQLRHSPVLLLVTVLGMAMVWLVPPACALFGDGLARWLGLAAWSLSSASYWPTLKRFGRSPVWAVFLPAIAAFYTAATIGSAIDHLRGRGAVWKNRAYGGLGA